MEGTVPLMRWEIHTAAQTVTFLWSLAVGALLCAWYDFFRLLRRHFHRGAVITFAEDVIFFSVSAVITFLFLLAREKGILRFYVLCGLALGFWIRRLTYGRFLLRIWDFIFLGLGHIFARIGNGIRKIILPIANFLKKGGISGKKWVKNRFFRKKTLEKG